MNFIYISFFRRRSASNEKRFFLTFQDLHARFNFNSTSSRMSWIQRSFNVDELHSKFKRNAYFTFFDSTSDFSSAFSPSFRFFSPKLFSLKKNLNMRLLNILIFDNSKSDVFFDWKFKMLNKLRYNADHFTETNKKKRKEFKIAYIIFRLDGEASIQTL